MTIPPKELATFTWSLVNAQAQVRNSPFQKHQIPIGRRQDLNPNVRAMPKVQAIGNQQGAQAKYYFRR
jgi:hypothetical protein